MAAGGERGCTEEGEEMRLRNANTGRISYAECRVGGHKSPFPFFFIQFSPLSHIFISCSPSLVTASTDSIGGRGKRFFIRDR